MDQELGHDEPADIRALGEKPPNNRCTELRECYGAHDQRCHHFRMALIGYEGKNVKVQPAHADVGNAEGDDDEPEGRCV